MIDVSTASSVERSNNSNTHLLNSRTASVELGWVHFFLKTAHLPQGACTVGAFDTIHDLIRRGVG